jgi:hypothetical protein
LPRGHLQFCLFVASHIWRRFASSDICACGQSADSASRPSGPGNPCGRFITHLVDDGLNGPVAAGVPPTLKTTGIVSVTDLAASAASVLPDVAITARGNAPAQQQDPKRDWLSSALKRDSRSTCTAIVLPHTLSLRCKHLCLHCNRATGKREFGFGLIVQYAQPRSQLARGGWHRALRFRLCCALGVRSPHRRGCARSRRPRARA